MSETTTQDSTPRTGSLTALRLPQLQEMAAGLGIKGYRRLRKSELIDAINSHSGGSAEKKSAPSEKKSAAEPAAKTEKPAEKQDEKKPESTNRRSSIPERDRIHSSDVSRVSSKSLLGTTRSGR